MKISWKGFMFKHTIVLIALAFVIFGYPLNARQFYLQISSKKRDLSSPHTYSLHESVAA